ncbi:MAG: RiPP maturation radical SAM protein 1 [Lachnospiraceae bacterium]|nr:RiPP maturation radical SAM protein 1 [Lachnospiraceae bacterium]
MNNKSEIILISMPFFDYRLPSAQLAVLKGYLNKENISTLCIHAYLDFYECIGEEYIDLINNYEYAEYFFIKFAYPERYALKRREINHQLQKDLKLSKRMLMNFYARISNFIDDIVNKIENQNCDLIAFSITYKQLLPSICVAKKLKNNKTGKKILFGGSRVSGELGNGIFSKEKCVDSILSGEGEYILKDYIDDYYRNAHDGRIISNEFIEAQEPVDLETLPVPDFDDYIRESSKYGINNGKVLIFYEVARGCWWNRCTFCSSRRLYKNYREKTPNKVANDLRNLLERYDTSSVWLLGDCYTFNSYLKLSRLMSEYVGKCQFMIYSRCSSNFKYYEALKKMGATSIIVGIEALSDSLLKKMDKGCDTIRNIQCLKYCTQLQLGCTYNLFYGYPNFSHQDYIETLHNIDFVLGYQPPESLCDMELQYGSHVYHDQKGFEICASAPDRKEMMILPDGAKTFIYECKTLRVHTKYSKKIIQRVMQWNKVYEKEGSALLTYQIVDGIVQITDKRKMGWGNKRKYSLTEDESKIFIMCEKITSRQLLENKLPGVDISSILKKLNKMKILFLTGKECLSIPIRMERDGNK